MIDRKKALLIRQAHRYLGIFLGVQFLMWTISGMYFSWTDIDEIHGDQFISELSPEGFSPEQLTLNLPVNRVESMELRSIGGAPHYWINDSLLLHAASGKVVDIIDQEQAIAIVQQHLKDPLPVRSVSLLKETGSHHEYRGRPLPAYRIDLDHPEDLTAYVAAKDGSFQRVRHNSWRWFDFLWMTHTMDYEGRDNFNTLVLRAFSALGLITVLSGFVLWFISSPTVRKVTKRKKKNKKKAISGSVSI